MSVWLGAGAITLGVGAAMATGAGVAHADDASGADGSSASSDNSAHGPTSQAGDHTAADKESTTRNSTDSDGADDTSSTASKSRATDPPPTSISARPGTRHSTKLGTSTHKQTTVDPDTSEAETDANDQTPADEETLPSTAGTNQPTTNARVADTSVPTAAPGGPTVEPTAMREGGTGAVGSGLVESEATGNFVSAPTDANPVSAAFATLATPNPDLSPHIPLGSLDYLPIEEIPYLIPGFTLNRGGSGGPWYTAYHEAGYVATGGFIIYPHGNADGGLSTVTTSDGLAVTSWYPHIIDFESYNGQFASQGFGLREDWDLFIVEVYGTRTHPLGVNQLDTSGDTVTNYVIGYQPLVTDTSVVQHAYTVIGGVYDVMEWDSNAITTYYEGNSFWVAAFPSDQWVAKYGCPECQFPTELFRHRPLPDFDGDGIPDAEDPDKDGDGVSADQDPDDYDSEVPGNTDPGTDPGTDPETDPETDPGTDPETDPGTDPETDPGTDPETDPGSVEDPNPPDERIWEIATDIANLIPGINVYVAVSRLFTDIVQLADAKTQAGIEDEWEDIVKDLAGLIPGGKWFMKIPGVKKVVTRLVNPVKNFFISLIRRIRPAATAATTRSVGHDAGAAECNQIPKCVLSST